MDNEIADQTPEDTKQPSFETEDTNWGYIVRSIEKTPLSTTIAQVAAWSFATLFFLTTIGLWVAPGISAGEDTVYIKTGASVFFISIGLFLLSYSVRGSKSEFHIEPGKNEMREVMINRSGAPTVLSNYEFRDLDEVIIRHLDEDKKVETLLLSYKNGMHFVPVISGSSEELFALKQRIIDDLGEREKPKVSLKTSGQTKRLFGEKIVSNAA